MKKATALTVPGRATGIFCRCRVCAPKPVSYTHLDVYKRQVVMQGMGLAPLVVVATTGQNSLMLAAAVALLLVPCLLYTSRCV